MKKENSIHTTVSTLSTIALMTLVISTSPVYSADIETNDVTPTCKVSQRGTRCKSGHEIEHILYLNNLSLYTSTTTCAQSSRGMRCKLNNVNSLMIAGVEALKSNINKPTCKTSPRGTRCRVALS